MTSPSHSATATSRAATTSPTPPRAWTGARSPLRSSDHPIHSIIRADVPRGTRGTRRACGRRHRRAHRPSRHPTPASDPDLVGERWVSAGQELGELGSGNRRVLANEVADPFTGGPSAVQEAAVVALTARAELSPERHRLERVARTQTGVGVLLRRPAPGAAALRPGLPHLVESAKTKMRVCPPIPQGLVGCRWSRFPIGRASPN